MNERISLPDLASSPVIDQDYSPAELSSFTRRQSDEFISTYFSTKKEKLEILLNLRSSGEPSVINETKQTPKFIGEVPSLYQEVISTGWKNVENVSAKLIEHYDDTVVLECLIDRENRIYEEREFLASLFEEKDLVIGKLFMLSSYIRKNEARIEIHSNEKLISKNDFPKLDYSSLAKESKLFKKRI